MKKRVIALFITFLFLFPHNMIALAYQNDNYSSDLKIGLKNMTASAINVTLNGNYYVDAKPYASGGKYDLKLSGDKISFDGSQYYELTLVPEKPDNTLTLTVTGTSVGTKKYSYRGSMTFKISNGKILPINIINIEDYLKGVVGFEMSNSYPVEALKAQAIAARNYALVNINKYRSEGYNLSDSTDCQVYRGYDAYYANVINAVDETRGMVLLYDDKLVSAYYSASNGGYTEACENVWVQVLPYSVEKVDEYDDEDWSYPRVFTTSQVDTELKNRGYLLSTDSFVKFDLENIQRYPSGRISRLDIIYKKADGTTASKYVSKESARIFLPLPSSLYWVTYDKTSDSYTFTGKGNGHGIGMSQIGAKNRANDGQTFEEILSFYYDGSYIERLVNAQDKLPPVLTSSIPADGETGVSIGKTIKLTFNENIQTGGNFQNIELSDEKGNVIDSDIQIDKNVLTIDPKDNLDYYTLYELEVPAGALSDLSGNLTDRDCGFSFKTEADTYAPKVSETDPENLEKNVELDDDVTITFNENIQRGNNFGKISLSSSDGRDLGASCSIEDNVLRISHIKSFNYYTTYTVKIPAYSIEDLWSNGIKSDIKFSFTTAKSEGPMIKSTSPKANYNSASVSGKITVTFDKRVYKDELFDSITLKDSVGRNVDIKKSISSSTISIEPINDLEYSTKYSLIIPEGSVKDSDGNTFVTADGDYLLEFRTQGDTTSPTIKTASPKSGSKYVPVNGSITITFSENVLPGYNYRDIKLKDPNGSAVAVKKTLNDNTMVITPVEDLDYYTKYTLEIPAGSLQDEAEDPNMLKTKYSLYFTTADNIAPTVKSSVPSSKYKDKVTDNVRIDSKITLTFSENIYEGSNLSGITLLDENGNKISASCSIKGTALTITPSTILGYNKLYIVIVPEGAIVDNVGNRLKDGYVFSFRTELDKISPVIKSVSPKSGEKNVGVNSSIAVVFSENIQIGDNFDSITLKAYNGDYVDLVLDETSIFGNTLIITPAEQLDKYKKYTLTIPAGAVKDLADSPNILKSKYTMSFTTEK